MKKYLRNKLIIIFGIVIIIAVVSGLVIYDPFSITVEENINKRMCSSITATPSWMNDNMDLIGVGVQPFGNTSEVVIDALIKKEIYFLYNPDCGACEQQIQFFSDDWARYVDSGFAVNCNEAFNG